MYSEIHKNTLIILSICSVAYIHSHLSSSQQPAVWHTYIHTYLPLNNLQCDIHTSTLIFLSTTCSVTYIHPHLSSSQQLAVWHTYIHTYLPLKQLAVWHTYIHTYLLLNNLQCDIHTSTIIFLSTTCNVTYIHPHLSSSQQPAVWHTYIHTYLPLNNLQCDI